MLREMEDFSASSVPSRFHPEEVGLMGIATTATIQVARTAIAPYVGPEGRERLAAEVPSSILSRLIAGDLSKRIRSDEYVWSNWTKLAEAVEWAADRGEWLGLHMA
jgi:hypothetical protein